MQDIMSLRSILYVPCDKERMIEKSLKMDCDGIIYDLEDAIAYGNKTSARQILCSKKSVLRNMEKRFFIRINAYSTEFFEDDIEAAVFVGAQGVILPKGDKVSVDAVSKKLKDIEADSDSIKIIPLIETAYCIEHISQILSSSDRIVAAQFGAEDLTNDLGIKRTKQGDEIFYARNRFVIACRAKNISAIDTPFTDFNDEDGLMYDSLTARNIGMTGKTCIHPNQIEIINNVFSPSDEEIEQARCIVDAFNQSCGREGVVVLDGKMIDKPIFNRAYNVLNKAKKYGKL